MNCFRYSDAVFSALSRLEEECFGPTVCDRIADWLLTLYDPENSAFYFKRCGKDTQGFCPEVEATPKAFLILRHLGLINPCKLHESYTPEMIRKLGDFAARHQSPTDGYWYELPWGKHIGDSKRQYESASAQQILNQCGRKPRYPTYTERIASSPTKAVQLECTSDPLDTHKYRSKEDFRAWFEKFLPWKSSYSAGSRMLSNLGDIVNNGYLPLALELLCERIHPETGFLNSDNGLPMRDYDHMSGTYKISWCFKKSKELGIPVPMPFFAQLMDSTAQVILSDEPNCSCAHIANPLALIGAAIETQPEPDPEVVQKYLEILPSILDRTREKILALMSPDGIYTSNPGFGSPYNQGLLTSTALYTGEVDGVSMVMAAREHLYNSLGLPLPPLRTHYTTEEYVRLLESQPTVKKILPDAHCQLDFSRMPAGSPSQLKGIRYTGDMEIVPDPASGENALRICVHNDKPVLVLDAGTMQGKGFTSEFTIRIIPACQCDALLSIQYGSWAFATVLTLGQKAEHGVLSRTADSSKQIASPVNWSEYHRIRVEYRPEGHVGHTKIWLDGKRIEECGHCTNGHPLQDAVRDIPCVQFLCGYNRPVTVYLSNFILQEAE